MENQKDWETDQTLPVPDTKIESNTATEEKGATFDPVKLLGETKDFLKTMGSKSVEAFGLPTFVQKPEKTESKNEQNNVAVQKPETTTAEPPVLEITSANADKKQADAKPSETKAAEAKPEAADAKPADAKKPNAPVLDKAGQEIANRVIDKIKDSTDPVKDIKEALSKLDNLKEANVTMNGRSSHIDIQLLSGKTTAPPNINVRGFRPVASHIDSHISFDLTPQRGGFSVTNMDGFSSSVKGPLGRIRHSETTSMFVGKDAYGGYINTSSDLYMRRRVHSSTTTLREQNMPADSPMRAMMQHPESLDKINSMLRLFQSTEDISKLGIKRNGDAFDVKSEARKANHVELDFKPNPEAMPVPIPITVKSLDLEKGLSASLTQEKDSVTLGKISGLTVNIEIGKLKASVCPSKVSIEKDKINLELKNPEDGSIMPVQIPIAKLREAAAKMKK